MDLDFLRQGVWENLYNKYVPYSEGMKRSISNFGTNYSIISIDEASKRKKSDTIVILGSGPSLNLFTGKWIERMKSFDSFGINYSLLKEDILPTYHQISYEPNNFGLNILAREISRQSERLSSTVFMLNSKTLWRLGHPLIMPEFFPDNPVCCYYKSPVSIGMERKRPFLDSDFEKSLVYRGTLTVVLHLAVALEYKNIILAGIDPQTPKHFFDDMPCMSDYIEYQEKRYGVDFFKTYENMMPKKGKEQTIDQYLYALRSYLLRKKKIHLWVAFRDSFLFPGLPAFF